MSIITISRGSYSRGREIAEKVAARLGYQCMSREILLSASDQYDIPEIKLIRAIHDAPSILDRLIYNKDKYINFIQTSLLKAFQKDNIVYHGLAGHFFVRGVPHVLKVRIISDMEDRIRCEMEREKISYAEARHILKKDDDQRRKWGLYLHGIDTSDPSLYDMVIHIRKLTVDDAADIICHALSKDHFKTTPKSQALLCDLALAAEVRSTVFDISPNIDVFSENGIVHITVKTHEMQGEGFEQEILETVRSVRGVKDVTLDITPFTIYTD